MATKIAVVCDIHYGEAAPCSGRSREFGDIFLLRVVHRLNKFVKPDIAVILGDIVDDEEPAAAKVKRQRIKSVLDLLDCPYLVIPGNHDEDADTFYQDFPRPPEIVELPGLRLLPFVDRDEPGYNASRRTVDLARFRRAREGFGGQLVALQHVCLEPPGRGVSLYNYIDALEIIREMKLNGVSLSISGHHHPGLPDHSEDGVTYINAPGLVEKPFPYLLVTLDGGRVEVERQQLANPECLGLCDYHVHTRFAYCSENMDLAKTVQLAKLFNLRRLGIAEHSGHLNFSNERYWSWICLACGIEGTTPEEYRADAYFALMASCRAENVLTGLEVDCDYQGRPLVLPKDAARTDYMVGALHGLKSLVGPEPKLEEAKAEFLWLQERFLGSGIDILAHPFRVFRKHDVPGLESLHEPLAKLLRQHGVAAEINFHHHWPDERFFRLCVDNGVKIAFGSDSHNLYEVGEFQPHLALMRRIGFDGDLGDIMWQPRRVG